MVRNIVILSGSSHPAFVDSIASTLGVPPSSRMLAKFSCGETRCEIRDSVRGKDVYIVQSFGVGPSPSSGCRRRGDLQRVGTDGGGGGSGSRGGDAEALTGDWGGDGEGNAEVGEVKDAEMAMRGEEVEQTHTVNDYFIELCIMISACKTGSAKTITAVLPLFPYSRQPDLPFSHVGAPRVGVWHPQGHGARSGKVDYMFESVPVTPGPNVPRTAELGSAGVDVGDVMGRVASAKETQPASKGTGESGRASPVAEHRRQLTGNYTTHDYENPSLVMTLQGQKQFMAQAGSLVADLLTCAGADRVLTCDLHESAYQGFFDTPVDNLYARPLLQRYIQRKIPNYREAVIVSPDAGGAKRATAIADNLGLAFALIHKERRPPKISETPKATMMLVGNVASRVCILIDDLVDTAKTITRAANLLKREGAVQVVALLTHGVLSGEAIARINASALDRMVVTNTVPQEKHRALCPKLEVLDVSGTFAEAIRRVHHGESVSMLFQYD